MLRFGLTSLRLCRMISWNAIVQCKLLQSSEHWLNIALRFLHHGFEFQCVYPAFDAKWNMRQ